MKRVVSFSMVLMVIVCILSSCASNDNNKISNNTTIKESQRKSIELNETVTVKSDYGDVELSLDSIEYEDDESLSLAEEFNEINSEETIVVVKYTAKNISYYDEYNKGYVSFDKFIKVLYSDGMTIEPSSTARQHGSYSTAAGAFAELDKGEKKSFVTEYIIKKDMKELMFYVGDNYELSINLDNGNPNSSNKGVSIVNHSLYNNTSAGVYQITYEIVNNTSKEISIYALASTQYDDNEMVLNNDDCYNNSGYLNVYNDSVSLKPNEKSNFYVCINNQNSVNIVDISQYKNDNKEYIDLEEPYAIELYGGERVYKENDDIKNTKQTKTSIVEETFTKATNIKKSDLTGSAGNWKYDGVPLLSKDCERIDNMLSDDNAISQGVIYRKIAFVLEGSNFKEKRFLYNYEDIGKYILGFVPKDKDEWVKYGKNASEFIVTDNQMTAIMKKFQSMKSVKGNYDFKYKKFGKFNIDIPDLTKCAEEMQISEKMLGYVLAMLDEYGTTITFEDNSCHIEYTSPM